MRDRLLLIPGTSGCKLLIDGVDIGWPGALRLNAWLCSSDALAGIAAKLGVSAAGIIEHLSMEFADDTALAPTKSTLAERAVLAPGSLIDLAYNQFRKAEVFAYDWRGDLRHNAELLLQRLEKNKLAPGVRRDRSASGRVSESPLGVAMMDRQTARARARSSATTSTPSTHNSAGKSVSAVDAAIAPTAHGSTAMPRLAAAT